MRFSKHRCPPPSIPNTPPRHSKVPPSLARQSWLTLILVLLLHLLRVTRLHNAKFSVHHETPPSNPPLFSLLHLHRASSLPSLHFFTAPKPFLGRDRHIQLRALESWLALSPKPIVTFLGDGHGYDQVVRAYGINWLPHVDTTFMGIPLFHSMLRATSQSHAVVIVLLNADIILYDDFPYALRKIRRDFPPGWLAVGARWDVQHVPGDVVGPGKRVSEHVRHMAVELARANGTLHTYGGIDLWAWDGEAGALLDGQVPSFVYGRGKYDNWLTHEIIRQNRRAVVDISEACTLVHVRHDHHLVGGLEVKSFKEQEFWSSDPRGKFELYLNSYLAASYGTFANQMGTVLHAPLKLASCYEHDGFCIFQRVRPHACRCEHSPFVADAQSDPYVVTDSRVIFCGLLSSNLGTEEVDLRQRFAITGRLELDNGDGAEAEPGKRDTTFGLPITQDDIFDVITSRTSTNKVFLVVADYSERMLVMELACSMRANGLFPWLMIAALDDSLYQFCVTRGLAVFLSEFDESEFRDHANFRELARFQLVFEALRKGKKVFSIEPGLVFVSSPWKYFDTVLDEDVDVATLPAVSKSTAVDSSYISSALVYARPSDKSLALIRKTMEGLQRHQAKAGMLLKTFACGEGDVALDNKAKCQMQNEAVLLHWDEQMFRTLEAWDCAHCPRPIAYYSASFGWANRVSEVVTGLQEAGLSRVMTEMDACRYNL